MNREDLTTLQQKVVDAVLCGVPEILVHGGPGSGKTTAALWSARQFLEQSTRHPYERVLFLTFSRAAVSQIVSRSVGVLAGFENRIEILTFHSLAFRLLSAFGRYQDQGMARPSMQSETHKRLLGKQPGLYVFDDLIPLAVKILQGSTKISDLLDERWPLVICDEVQDTGDEHWELMECVGPKVKLCLGDDNQMIYTFLPGVSKGRFDQIKSGADEVIPLETASHRDPSGTIPALSDAIRQRAFEDEAVTAAMEQGRISVVSGVSPEELGQTLREQIIRARRSGSRSIGIFAQTNLSVAELAETLTAEGIDHVLIGIPEAHAQALSVMEAECKYALGLAEWDQVTIEIALFLSSTTRTGTPELARAIMDGDELPVLVTDAIEALRLALTDNTSGTMAELLEVVCGSWQKLPLTGQESWKRAVAHFRRLARAVLSKPCGEEALSPLLRTLDAGRSDSLVDRDYSELGAISLMNFHQTKGREADTVIHVYTEQDYFPGREPYPDASRVLYVALSRARRNVVIMLPPNPSGLVAPFLSTSTKES